MPARVPPARRPRATPRPEPTTRPDQSPPGPSPQGCLPRPCIPPRRNIRRSVVCFCVSEGCGIGAQIRTLCYGLPSARGCAEPSSDRAILSPMIAVDMLVFPEMMAGISDASATYRPSIPCTRPSGSTTESGSLAAPSCSSWPGGNGARQRDRGSARSPVFPRLPGPGADEVSLRSRPRAPARQQPMRWRCWPVDKVAGRSNYRHTEGTQSPQQPVKEHRHVHVVGVHLIKMPTFPDRPASPTGPLLPAPRLPPLSRSPGPWAGVSVHEGPPGR